VNYLPVPAEALRDGENELRVSCDGGQGTPSDDVALGEVELIDRPRAEALGEASLSVEVVDGDGGKPLPCRIAIADPNGGRVSLGTASGPTLAVRPGVVYTGDGHAEIKLPAGKYTVYAGRGFEYSLSAAEVELRPGGRAEKKLSVRC